MRFTGERFIPTEEGKIQLEHYHRYAVVRDLVAGKHVLDVACGEGYGSSMLADLAVAVTGVDISSEAVQHAAATYVKPNLTYIEGSATALPFADASFDMVVSFETIEHLAGQVEMVAELRRVLRPEGMLVISSPNRPVYSEESGEHHEFHVKELDFAEFDALLKVQFPAVRYLGQRMLMGSVIQPLSSGPDALRAWHMEAGTVQNGSGLMQDPVYFVAICAASENLLPETGVGMTSFVHPGKLDLIKQYVGFAKWAKAQDEAVAERDGHIRRMQHDAEEHLDFIKKLQARQAECEQQLQSRLGAAASLNSDMHSLRQVVVEREASLDALRQMLADRERGMDSLRQLLTDRDSGLDALRQLLADRDNLLLELRERLAERDEGLALMRGLHDKIFVEAQAFTATHNARILEGQRSSDAALSQSRDQAILDLRHELEYCHQHISSLIDETVRRGEWGLRLDAEIKEARDALKYIVNTNSWRVTRPLREARRWVSAPITQGKRYVKGSLRFSKRFYQGLPLSHTTKAAHRSLLSRLFPRLLLLSGSHSSTVPSMALPAALNSNEPLLLDEDIFQTACGLDLPLSDTPLVSVIIPIYGQIGYTIRCLASIQKYAPGMPFEIIVVNDCSRDNSLEVLAQVRGIRLVRNEVNQGFIRSCNAGAAVAKGAFLCFLNNDTEVSPRWLDELLRTFSTFPGTGLSGSKLVYPDGRLQEAGGILWQDGSAWNFGRLQDPLLPAYNYAREVDYCSGASIMIPTSLFVELGGFDEHYLPAYCEDSDLALKIREKGYRVIYQPMSVIVHYEGITSGTDLQQGAKAYQVSNSKKLFERWQPFLANYQPNGVDVDNAKDRASHRRVLVLDHCTPTPDQDAGSVTVFNTLLLLRDMGFQVTFIPEDNFLYMPDYTVALQRIGIEVLYAPYVNSVEQHLKESGERYDLVLLFRPVVVERNIKAVKKYCKNARVLYHTVDLHFLRMEREAELQNDPDKRKAAAEMKEREFATIQASDLSIVHSTAELTLLAPELPDEKISVFPLIMDVRGTEKKFLQRRDIVFVGGYQHAPNVDAVQYFVQDIMPLLRERLPGVRVRVVGSSPPPVILEMASEDVIIEGFVEDLSPLLDQVRVSLAPLRYGAGIKGKIGTALAAGLPVVATSLAAEGMGMVEGEHVLVADGPDDFAAAIVRLYEDEALWNKLSKAGIVFADQAWGAEAAWTIMADILSDLGFEGVQRGNRPLAMYRLGM